MDIFYGIVTFLSGLGLLLFAIKALGESMDKMTGSKFRQTVAKSVGNRFGAMGMGVGFTVLLQSSTASMAMFVVLCNAGIISLSQAISVVLGVNIGAAITHVVVLFGSVKIVQILCILSCIGIFIFLFARSQTVKNAGKLVASIGLIFLGITVMSQGMSVINEMHLIDGFIKTMSSPPLLVLLFMVFTCLVQTSMGAMAVLITFVGTVIPLNSVIWAVMGINLGTSISSMLLVVGTSANAKRVGLTHVLFNILATILFTILNLILPLGDWIVSITSVPGLVVIINDLMFNLVVALILLPFVNYLAKFMQNIFKESKQKTSVGVIAEEVIQVPNLAMPQVVNNLTEIFNKLVADFFDSMEYLIKQTPKLKVSLTKDCLDLENANNALEDTIIQLTSGVSQGDKKLLSKLLDIVHKNRTILRKIQKILFYAGRWNDEKFKFTAQESKDIKEMCENISLISVQSQEALKNIDKEKAEKSESSIIKVLEYDNKVDEIKSRVRLGSISGVDEDKSKLERFSTYTNIINAVEDVSEVFATVAIIALE